MSVFYPPRYLSELPSLDWFFAEFGMHYEVTHAAWAKRAQLVLACEAQNWRCCYCGRRIDIPPHAPVRPLKWEATREHVVPRSHGGEDGFENEVAACAPCNTERGVSDAYTFKPARLYPPSVRVFGRAA